MRLAALQRLDLHDPRYEETAAWRVFLREVCLCVSIQVIGTLLTHCVKVKDACPLLERYEEAWPARCYVNRYLRRKALAQTHSVRPRSQRVPQQRIRASVCAMFITIIALHYSINMQPRPIFQGSRVKRAASPVFSSRRPATTASNDATRSNGPQAQLQRFLHSLDPSLESLAELFESSGVKLPAELTHTKRWTEAERRAFFKDDVKLSPFQARALDVALMQARE